MKILRIYKDGAVTGDNGAFISPFRGAYNEYDITDMSQVDIDLLSKKAYNSEKIDEPDILK